MTPFQPVRADQRPYWRVLYEYVVGRMESGDLQVGDIVTFAEFQAELGEGIDWRQPLHKATKHLRDTHQRSLDSVRGVGYKLIAGMDQVKQGKKVRRRANRTLERSHQHYMTVDRRLLDMNQAQKLDLAVAASAVLIGWAKETDARVARIEDDLAVVQNAQREHTVLRKATDSQVDELRRRLEALEGKK